MIRTVRNRAELLICLGLFLLAALLRLPFESHPAEIVSDEGSWATFIANTSVGRPFFEGQPPLGWLVPAFALKPSEVIDRPKYPIDAGSPFENFPFDRLRFINGILGSLLPVLIYRIVRQIGLGRTPALLSTVLVIFDNALIIYSRIILSETLMVSLAFLGVLSFLKADQSSQKKAALFLSGVLGGLSGAVKWVGLGATAGIMAFLGLTRSYKKLFLVTLGIICAYSAVFFLFTTRFESGPAQTDWSYSRFFDISQLHYPKIYDLPGELNFFWNYNRDILAFHETYGAPDHSAQTISILNPGAPYLWPLSLNPMAFWQSKNGAGRIVLSGNRFGWAIGLLAVIYGLGKVIFELLKNRKNWLDRNRYLIFLLLGYFGSYLPFFFISRRMYLYNYFSALLFSYILAAFLLTDLKAVIRPRLLAGLLTSLAFGLIAFFVLQAKTTYGL